MTLGEYIEILEKLNKRTKVRYGLGNPHSWRGSYDEITFEVVENTTIGKMLKEAKSAVGTTYTGWKGGDFTMKKNTQINIDRKGSWSDGRAMWMLLISLITKS